MLISQLPDEVLHLVGQFIINIDQDLFENLYKLQTQPSSHNQFPFRSLIVKHSITACHYYFFLLGMLNKEFHHRINNNPYFWKRNLFYLDQLTRYKQIGECSKDDNNDEDLYEEEYDEETDEIIQVLVREREPTRVIDYKQMREMMEKCELNRMYLRVESKLIQTMVNEDSFCYHVRELMIDCRNVDLFSVFDLIVHHCPFIERVRILMDSPSADTVGKRIYQEESGKVKCPLKQLRIIINSQSNSINDSTRKVFNQLMENYLPKMNHIEEIVLPVWSPSILNSISLNCRKLKKLMLLGELCPGEYNQSFENICDNIEALESFVISKSVTRGFYIDIGQAHFMRILTKFSKSLKEFVMGTNLSRFSSPRPEESIQFEEELAANLPKQLETLIIENIPDHYYNSSTPLAFINILTSLFNRSQNNVQFNFKNLIIDLNNFHLDNLNSISMRNVENLYLRLSNSDEILLHLSKREYISNIRTLTLDVVPSTIKQVSSMLNQPFFSNIEELIIVNNGNSLLDLTPLATIPNLKSFRLMSNSNQNYAALYRDDIPMRNNSISNPGTCFVLNTEQSLEEIDGLFEEEFLFGLNTISNVKFFTCNTRRFYSNALHVLVPLTRNFSRLETFDITIHTGTIIRAASISEKLRIMKNIKYASLCIENNEKGEDGVEMFILFYIITYRATVSDLKCHCSFEPSEDISEKFDNIFYKFIAEEDHLMYEEVKEYFTRQLVENFKDSSNDEEMSEYSDD